jgi:hypothetical protein
MMAKVKLKKFEEDKTKIAMKIVREKEHLKQEKFNVSFILLVNKLN